MATLFSVALMGPPVVVCGFKPSVCQRVDWMCGQVDGVYDCDPNKHPDAKLHRKLSYKQVTTQDLDVMDQTAITLCKENSIPVVVFNLTKAGNIIKALTGHPEAIGTTVDEEGEEGDSDYDEAPAASDADTHLMYDAASM